MKNLLLLIAMLTLITFPVESKAAKVCVLFPVTSEGNFNPYLFDKNGGRDHCDQGDIATFSTKGPFNRSYVIAHVCDFSKQIITSFARFGPPKEFTNVSCVVKWKQK